MFKELTGETAVVKKGGRFKTCPLYSYRGHLFIKDGSSFVRLNADGGSSVDGLNIDLLAYEGPLFKDKFGRLAVEPHEGYIALQAQPDGTIALLEAPI